MKKLNQVIAAEAAVKKSANEQINSAYKEIQKAHRWEGFTKTYQPDKEDDDPVPTERKRVELRAAEVLSQLRSAWAEVLAVTLMKDLGNTQARGDVEVDGTVLLFGVPVPYLLFLEKRLKDIRTVVDAIPVLDAAYDWTRDEAQGLHRSDPVETVRTRKVQEALVLHPPTEKHPAQTQMISVDRRVGTYTHTHQSGAMPYEEKAAILRRIDVLSKAVLEARERGNVQDVEEQSVDAVMDYIFG